MDFQIRMLPVSGGDATLLSANRMHILIDTGFRRDHVARTLQHEGIRSLELLVLSHTDLDHVGGLVEILQDIPVGEIWCLDIWRVHEAIEAILPRLGHEGECSANELLFRLAVVDRALSSEPAGQPNRLDMPVEGMRRSIGGFDISVLWPPQEFFEFALRPGHLRVMLGRRGEAIPASWLHAKHLTRNGLKETRSRVVAALGSIARAYGAEVNEERASEAWSGCDFANNLSTVLSVHFDARWPDARMLFPGDLEDWRGGDREAQGAVALRRLEAASSWKPGRKRGARRSRGTVPSHQPRSYPAFSFSCSRSPQY